MGKNKTSLNTNSDTYTIVYSAVIVVIVAFVLAFVASALKPAQEVNVALDKKKQILAALNIRDISDDKVAEIYTRTIRRDDIIDCNGKTKKEGTRGGESAGFKLNSADYKAGDLALYVCDIDGKTKYVIPVYGMGLWGPISGYISIDDDLNTVYGAYFTHESETAGLGAEIKDNEAWQKQFSGKKIMKSGYKSIALQVVKPNDVKDKSVQCDGVTGATLTSDGVSNMLRDCLGKYIAFLTQER
ncbi:MAG: NADH:ubiquinone reductase (Na(+)-transporting) subunit C [Prevotella sp.]